MVACGLPSRMEINRGLVSPLFIFWKGREIGLDNEKIQELLLQILQDMSFVKAKLSNIEEQKLNSRIDQLEAQNREHDKTIKSLERRNDTMEQFVRNNMQDSKKQQTSIFISMGLAVFSAIVSLIFSLLM